jgi:hypothetical protein
MYGQRLFAACLKPLSFVRDTQKTSCRNPYLNLCATCKKFNKRTTIQRDILAKSIFQLPKKTNSLVANVTQWKKVDKKVGTKYQTKAEQRSIDNLRKTQRCKKNDKKVQTTRLLCTFS